MSQSLCLYGQGGELQLIPSVLLSQVLSPLSAQAQLIQCSLQSGKKKKIWSIPMGKYLADAMVLQKWGNVSSSVRR